MHLEANTGDYENSPQVFRAMGRQRRCFGTAVLRGLESSERGATSLDD